MPLTTTSVHLVITEVGPWKGSAFGGIVAIKIFGCYADSNYQSQPDTISQSEEDPPAEIDWYDEDSYESSDEAIGNTDTQDRDEEEDDIFSSYQREDYQESSDQLNQEDSVEQERHTDEDWFLFGSFESDNKLEKLLVRKEENPRKREKKEKFSDSIDKDDETEERLKKSNWPKFDSISVDADYDESIVEKREGNPSNKRTTLYIIREVFTWNVSVTLNLYHSRTFYCQ